jgi:hypothetical protein
MKRSPAEKALLTYQAMTQSDDIIILMERVDGAPTADALIIAANDAFYRSKRRVPACVALPFQQR